MFANIETQPLPPNDKGGRKGVGSLGNSLTFSNVDIDGVTKVGEENHFKSWHLHLVSYLSVSQIGRLASADVFIPWKGGIFIKLGKLLTFSETVHCLLVHSWIAFILLCKEYKRYSTKVLGF